MQHVIFAAWLLAAAAAFAALEVQIEGEAGWAASLPTWRVDNRWTRVVLGGRPLTGYHLWCHAVILVLVHLPYGLGYATPSLPAEARILSFLVLFWIIEDFLWFVINPRYGVGRFTAEHVPWHRHAWWGFMPREYWIGMPVGIALYVWSVL